MMIKTMRFSKDRRNSPDELTLLPIDVRKRCASVFPYPLFALGDDDEDEEEFDDYEDDFDDDEDDEDEDYEDYEDDFDDEEEDDLDDEDDL
ncbi:MAG: hypothetical protein LBC46_02030 [Treponema sp.]|jgi:hypothetical protein|nr:hypothetical protein [Treponema sp.]